MWERDHLWLYVLGLDFHRKAAEDKGISVGRNMFDKPNHGAFGLFTHFLLTKLDAARTAEIFPNFHFLGKTITSLEFRKQCCKWLKEIITNEDESRLLQITPSSFISPVGPKINCILYRLARHVMIKDLQKNSGTEPVKLKSKNMYLANARCRVAYNKLLQFFQKETFVIHEYQKKVMFLVKEIKQMQSANADLEIQSCKKKHNDQTRNNEMERIQKVRSMWALIMEVLTSLKKQKELVGSILDVLEGCVGQCILDGTKVVFRVPQLLACRVEGGIHEVCKGNVYEGEKVNFLTVIQLLNEALRTLRDECCLSELNQQIQGIENMVTDHKKVLQDLKAKRLKIEQEHCVSMSESISGKQKAWEVKWKKFLGLCPLKLTLQQDPELDLRALLPHSFNLTEDDDKDSFFYQHLLSVSDEHNSVHGVRYEEDCGALETVVDKLPSPPNWLSSSLELSKASENKNVLIEKNVPAETCNGGKNPVPPKVLKNEKDKSTISEMWQNVGDHVIQTEAPVKKDPTEKARDELAEEVVKAVMTESPQGEEGTGMPLHDLISSLVFNPFLTRKEIPRTPENTVPEIRSSWRKAVKTEGSSDVKLDPTEVVTEEAPMDARPIMQKAADSRFQCSTSASPIPDSYLPLSEFKSQLNSAEFRPQEQMRISHISKSPVLETSEMQEGEITEEQGTSVEDPEEQNFQYIKSMNTLDIFSENNNRTNTLPSDHVWDSLNDKMLHCFASPCGILGETLPEELSYIDSNESTNSESDFDVIRSAYVTDDSKNEGIEKSKLDIQSLFNTHKALERTASRSEEELDQMPHGGESVSCRSDLNLAQEKRDEFYSPLEFFCLDEEFTNMPSSASPNERKHSLSSLLISCQQLEEMASMIQDMPLDLIHKLKDEEWLSEELDTKEQSSG